MEGVALLVVAFAPLFHFADAHAEAPASRNVKSARIAGMMSQLRGQPDASQALSFFVIPQTQIFVDAWTEYSPTDCTVVSTGAWTVNRKPKFGKTTTATINGQLGNGDCPGVTFQFAAIYYTWTSPDKVGATADPFTATWSSPDYSTKDVVSITLTAPTNYAQTGPGVAQPNGTLHFEYSWQSTTGSLTDLSQCQVGENVKYPGTANPYRWPSPPYNGASPNPTVIWLAATEGGLQDNHSHAAFLAPYVANVFDATQAYRYRCTGLDAVSFPNWSNITIERSVADSTGKGCWNYTISKSGSSASVPRLPGVPKSACTALEVVSAEDAAIPQADLDREIGISIQPPDTDSSQHAPIRVELGVVNRGPRTVSVDLGLNKVGNLQLTIQDPSGTQHLRTLRRVGFGSIGSFVLSAGASQTQKILLNEWYDFPVAGIYRARISLLAETDDESEVAASSRPSAEFEVRIGARDAAALRHTAEQLADTATSDAPVAERMEAANTLSFIRDPVAVASLVRVLTQGKLVEHYAVDGLARVATPDAIAALEAARNSLDEDLKSRAAVVLDALRKQGERPEEHKQ